LLIINFLHLQLENGKNILIENGNLGRLFYEFLLYYGMEFNPKNNIIDTNNKIEQMPFFDRKYVIYYFF
jgi:DNA polymerase sigma